MFELWKILYEKLIADAVLVTLLGHTPTDRRVKRGWQQSSTKKPCLIFQQTSGSKLVPEVEAIRDYYFTLTALSEKSDTEADNVIERAILVLTGMQLSSADVRSFLVTWDGFASGVYYDETEKAWRIDARFKIIFLHK